ncbi:MAG: hypothetical protein E7239_01245, partial [Sarcina sp.]|nr:hypothetical protein [Sarcina sp.]
MNMISRCWMLWITKRYRNTIRRFSGDFFSNLKSLDEYIQFVLITGVSKFHKVSIFSDLNQLNDISLDEDYADILGITEEEMLDVFSPEIEALAERRKLKDVEFDVRKFTDRTLYASEGTLKDYTGDSL